MNNFERANELISQNVEQIFDVKKRNGDERIICSPFRNEKEPSLYINIIKHVYNDFGNDFYKGDNLSLYSQINGISPQDAMKEIINRYGHPSDQEALRDWSPTVLKGRPKKAELTPVIPVPEDMRAEGEREIKKIKGFSAIYPYIDIDGNLTHWRIRYYKDEKKNVMPYGLFTDVNGNFRFQMYDPGSQVTARRMYGEHKLIGYDGKRILIVEGEKAADAAQKALKKWLVLSVPNGEGSFDTCDVTELAKTGAYVYLWPDNDLAGKVAAPKLAQRLDTQKVYILKPNNEWPKKYDVFDWLYDNPLDSVEEIILASELFKKEEKETPKKRPFEALGFDSEKYYFRSGRTGNIIDISRASMDKRHLLPVANLEYFAMAFGEEDKYGNIKIDWDTAIDTLMILCEKQGTYSLKNVRGRGVWRDNGEIIVFDGEYIHKNGEKYNMLDYDAEYVYERCEKIDYFPKSRDFDLKILSDNILKLAAAHDGQLKYLLGWCVTAPLCGILHWRPHIWAHGLSGSGKTTIIEEFALELLGPIAYKAKGNSTEAGIRQTVRNDARPFIVDDVKKNGASDHTKIEKLLDLMRSVSSDTDATTVMGTSGQKAIERYTKTMFLVSSVKEQSSATEDKNRITPVEMLAGEGLTKREYLKYILDVRKDFRNGLGKYFIRSVIENIETIIDNIDVFMMVLSDHVRSSRDADQLAPLIAGYYHIINESKTVDVNEAQKFIRQFPIADQSARTAKEEHDLMFEVLMHHRIRYNDSIAGFSVEKTVAHLISIVMADDSQGWEKSDAHMALREYGFRYNYSNNKNKLLIACAHHKIEAVLDTVNLGLNYSSVMKEHKYCTGMVDSVRVYTGENSRQCMAFDISKVIGEDAEEKFDAKYESDNQIDVIPF